jgi:hypothetical protein
MPVSLGEWFLTHYNDHVKQRSNPDKSKRPLECTVCPGDILFVPHGWWHSVLNLDESMSVALTQNYVSKSNLPDVLRFLETKKQQISGCRDRSDAIQPDKLLEAFRESLGQCRPDLLLAAQKIANNGFQCAAWSNNNHNRCKVSQRKKKKVKIANQSIVQLAKQRKISQSQGDSGGFSFSFI